MDEHDAASDWASQNPNDPRSQDIMAKSWAMKNQNDPRSAMILNKLKGSQSGNPQAVDSSVPQPVPPGVNPYNSADVQSIQSKNAHQNDSSLTGLLKGAVSAGAGVMTGVAKAGTLGMIDFPHLLGTDKTSPMAVKAGEFEGSIGVGAMTPEASSAVGRIAVGAGLGAAQNPDNRLQGAVTGGLVGTGLEGLKGLLSGVSRAGSTIKMASGLSKGSPDLQDQAIDKIQQTAQSLRNSPINDVKNDLLSKANVQINPTEYLGKTPEIDQMIRNAIADKSQYGMIPDKLTLSGTQLNEIRQNLDASIPWKSMPFNTLQAQDIQKGQDIQALANKTRDALHSISPELDNAMTQVSSNIKGASYLEKKGPSALGTLSSENPDKMATLNKLGEDAGTDIGDYADKMRSANNMRNKPIRGTVPALVKQGFKGAKQGLSEASGVNSPTTLSGILSLLK